MYLKFVCWNMRFTTHVIVLGSSSILKCRISNICFCFLQAGALENIKTNMLYSRFDTSKSMSYQGYHFIGVSSATDQVWMLNIFFSTHQNEFHWSKKNFGTGTCFFLCFEHLKMPRALHRLRFWSLKFSKFLVENYSDRCTNVLCFWLNAHYKLWRLPFVQKPKKLFCHSILYNTVC